LRRADLPLLAWVQMRRYCEELREPRLSRESNPVHL
jgi:hypothetical protein